MSFSDIQVISESQPLIKFPDLNVETQVDTDENSIINPDYISIVVDGEDTTALIFSYKKWNKLLIDYFFQLQNEGKKSHALYMKNCLMKFQTSIYTFRFRLSIEKELRVNYLQTNLLNYIN
jgi:hypothetical protein